MTVTKRGRLFGILTTAVLAATLLVSCGKSEFGMIENTEKAMTISAENADKDAFFMVGTLEAENGDKISMQADLKKGVVRVEIVGAPEEQSQEKMPDMQNGEVLLTGDLRASEAASGTSPGGSYMVRATCLEKATGTIRITVEPAQ